MTLSRSRLSWSRSMEIDRFEFKSVDGKSVRIAVSYDCEDGEVVFATPLSASINGKEIVDGSKTSEFFREWTEHRLHQIDCGGEPA